MCDSVRAVHREEIHIIKKEERSQINDLCSYLKKKVGKEMQNVPASVQGRKKKTEKKFKQKSVFKIIKYMYHYD